MGVEMITFETEADFEAAVLRVIRDNMTFNVTCRREDYYSKNETLSIELEITDPDATEPGTISIGTGYATIPHF